MKISFILALAICVMATSAQSFEIQSQDGNPNAANFSDPDDKDPHFNGTSNSSDQNGADNNYGNFKFTVGGSSDSQTGFSDDHSQSSNNK